MEKPEIGSDCASRRRQLPTKSRLGFYTNGWMLSETQPAYRSNQYITNTTKRERSSGGALEQWPRPSLSLSLLLLFPRQKTARMGSNVIIIRDCNNKGRGGEKRDTKKKRKTRVKKKEETVIIIIIIIITRRRRNGDVWVPRFPPFFCLLHLSASIYSARSI